MEKILRIILIIKEIIKEMCKNAIIKSKNAIILLKNY